MYIHSARYRQLWNLVIILLDSSTFKLTFKVRVTGKMLLKFGSVYTAQWYIHVYIQTTYIHTDTQTDRQTIVYMYKKITLNLLRTELFIKQYRLKRSSTSSDSDKMKSYELSIHFISGYSYLSIYLYILYQDIAIYLSIYTFYIRI